MPIRPIEANFDTPEEELMQRCRDAELKGKELNEVFHSFDGIRVWRSHFERTHGALLNFDHRSNPDDPPDLVLHFRNGSISVEHTRLEPYPYGWVNALHFTELSKHCISLPPITRPPTDRNSLLDAMLSPSKNWSNVGDDLNEWRRVCGEVISKKVKRGEAGILVIQDTSLLFDSYLKPVAEAIYETISDSPELLRGWTVILHSRSNPVQFTSYLISCDESLRRKMVE